MTQQKKKSAPQIPDQLRIDESCVVCMELGNWPYFFDGRANPPAGVDRQKIDRACRLEMNDSVLKLGQKLLVRSLCLLSIWAIDQKRNADKFGPCQRCAIELVDALERHDVEHVRWWCIALWPVLKKLSEAEPDVSPDEIPNRID